MITILVGESASGKDTIQRELVKGNFIPLISTTTRPPREGEKEGVDYHFVSKEEFELGIKKCDFLEYRSYNVINNDKPDVWYYGTPKQELDPKKDYVKILDVQGAKDFVQHYGAKNCFVVYVFADDLTRQQRAIDRGSFDLKEWTRRLADDEIKFMDVRSVANYTAVNMCRDQHEFDNMIYQIEYCGKVYDAHRKDAKNRYICKLYMSEDEEVQCLVTNENYYVKEFESRIETLHEISKE